MNKSVSHLPIFLIVFFFFAITDVQSNKMTNIKVDSVNAFTFPEITPIEENLLDLNDNYVMRSFRFSEYVYFTICIRMPQEVIFSTENLTPSSLTDGWNEGEYLEADNLSYAGPGIPVILLEMIFFTDEDDEEDSEIVFKQNYEHFLKGNVYLLGKEEILKFINEFKWRKNIAKNLIKRLDNNKFALYDKEVHDRILPQLNAARTNTITEDQITALIPLDDSIVDYSAMAERGFKAIKNIYADMKKMYAKQIDNSINFSIHSISGMFVETENGNLKLPMK